MAEDVRIGVEQAHRDVSSGAALLVCGYDDDAKYRRIALAGSIPLAELESRLPSLPESQEIVFYCA